MKIAILGYGTVGRGTYDILQERKNRLEDQVELEVKKVLMLEKEVATCGLDKSLTSTDYQEILDDPEIECIVEVTGAKKQGFLFMKEALEAKKHVVTANKAVVSKHFSELNDLADRYKVHFLYEAAVGGGIPILTPLKSQALLNNIDSIEGILNGTCNYILSNMQTKAWGYEETLKKAQDLGFAEADPTDDVEGFDTLRKLVILSSIAQNILVNEDEVALEGISNLGLEDVAYFKDQDLKVKLLASYGKKGDDSYSLIVEPVLIGRDHPLYNVDGETNAITLHGHNVDQLTFMGPGAGKYPTGNAVVCDLIDVARGSDLPLKFGDKTQSAENNIQAAYYISSDQDLNLPEDWFSNEGEKIDGHRAITKVLPRDSVIGTLENLRKAGQKIFFARLG